MNYPLAIIGSFLILLLAGCSARGPKDAQEAAGEYIYGYARTRELEVLTLNADNTYRQDFFKDLESYHNNTGPVFTNTGQWSYSNNVIELQDCLAFCENGNPEKRLFPPKRYSLYPVYWFPKTSEHDASILVARSFDYGFSRVTNRAIVQP